MIRKRKQKKTPKVQQHQVEPTSQIVVSALFNSIFNAKSRDAMGDTIEVFIEALNSLHEYDQHAYEVFIDKLYTEMMKHEYTKFGLNFTGEKFVEMGLSVPKE